MATPVYIVGGCAGGAGFRTILESLALGAVVGLGLWKQTHPAFAIGGAIGALCLYLYIVHGLIRHARLLYWLYAMALSGLWAILGYLLTVLVTPDPVWQLVGLVGGFALVLLEKKETFDRCGPDGDWNLI